MEKEFNSKLVEFELELSKLKKVSELLNDASQISSNSAIISHEVTESFKKLSFSIEDFIEMEKKNLDEIKTQNKNRFFELVSQVEKILNEVNPTIDKKISALIDSNKAELNNIGEKDSTILRQIRDEVQNNLNQIQINLREKVQESFFLTDKSINEATGKLNINIEKGFKEIKTELIEKTNQIEQNIILKTNEAFLQQEKQIKQLKIIGIIVIVLIVGFGILNVILK